MKYFLVQIKQTNGVIDKGVVVKDTLDSVGGQHDHEVWIANEN